MERRYKIEITLIAFAALAIHALSFLNDIRLTADIIEEYQIESSILRASENMIVLQIMVKNFLLTKDTKFINSIQNEEKSLEWNLEMASVKNTLSRMPYSKNISIMQRNSKKYISKVEKIIRSEKALGLDENSGLQGEMRNKAHALEKLTKFKLELKDDLLMLRRHEKDFIMRGNQIYIDKFDKVASDMGKLASDDINNALSKYTDAFHAYSAKYLNVERLKKEKAKNENEIRGVIIQMHRSISMESNAFIIQKYKRNNIQFFSAMAALLIGICILVLSSGSPGGRKQSLTKTLK